MKKILITFLILSLILISSCSLFENGENGMNTTKMTAKIIAINEKLEVEVVEGEYGASGIYWVITGADTFFEDAQGNKISRSELGEGDIRLSRERCEEEIAALEAQSAAIQTAIHVLSPYSTRKKGLFTPRPKGAYNVGDLGLIPGLGRSPGEGNGNPLQYSCLENPMD